MSFHCLGDNEAKIRKLLEEGKAEKAYKSAYKSLVKSPNNPEAPFLLSIIYLDTVFTGHHVDTSYMYISKAIILLDSATDKEKRKLNKTGINYHRLLQQKDSVEFFAFLHYNRPLSIQDYKSYLSTYQDSVYVGVIKQKLDSAAFVHAKSIGTWQAYKQYASEYPNAKEAPVARTRMEKLLYEEKAKGKTVEEQKQFLKDHPETSHKSKILSSILNAVIDEHTASGYEDFIHNYSTAAASRHGSRFSLLFTKK